MTAGQRGLIANISFWAAQKYLANVIYGIAKAATDKLTADTAHELKRHNVTVVSLYPGLVATEKVIAAGVFDLSRAESPAFAGRAVAALASDPAALRWTGQVVVAAALAREYGFADEAERCRRHSHRRMCKDRTDACKGHKTRRASSSRRASGPRRG
jgi:NAD(P)-dependent dehydrogenase (short-subunit alcohol dehydrogenase family)